MYRYPLYIRYYLMQKIQLLSLNLIRVSSLIHIYINLKYNLGCNYDIFNDNFRS